MAFARNEEICPICKRVAVVTKKWVANKYRRRYSYTLYHHSNEVHYINESLKNQRALRKGELKKSLIDTINSENFKNGLFRAEDAKNSLVQQYQNVTLDLVRDNLYKLVELGMLNKTKKDRKVYFINTAYSDRLSFVDDSIRVILSDLDNDGHFKGHESVVTVRNDKPWPLYYLPYKILGDSDIDFDHLKFRAWDLSHGVELKTHIIEDNPREKRLILKLPRPSLPGETIKIKIEYEWTEQSQSFFYSAATYMKSFNLIILTNLPLEVRATEVSSTLNEMRDLSTLISIGKREKWKYTYTLKLKSIRPFTVLRLRWTV